MENNDKNFDRIEDFLFGHSNDQEKKALNDDAAKDEQLAADLALHQLEHRAMELLARQELKANLDSWKAERQSEAQPSAKIVSFPARRRFLQYAAAACVLLVAGFFIWNWFGQTPGGAALAGQYFGETSYSSRSADPGLPPTLLPALQSLQKQDYAQAIGQLENISDSSHVWQARLLLGEAHFFQKDYPKAVAVFQQVAQSDAPILDRHEAEWRLVLTYLAMGQKGPVFQALLDRILADTDHSHQPDAVSLRAKL